jgi:chromosome segregation ATPase
MKKSVFIFCCMSLLSVNGHAAMCNSDTATTQDEVIASQQCIMKFQHQMIDAIRTHQKVHKQVEGEMKQVVRSIRTCQKQQANYEANRGVNPKMDAIFRENVETCYTEYKSTLVTMKRVMGNMKAYSKDIEELESMSRALDGEYQNMESRLERLRAEQLLNSRQ